MQAAVWQPILDTFILLQTPSVRATMVVRLFGSLLDAQVRNGVVQALTDSTGVVRPPRPGRNASSLASISNLSGSLEDIKVAIRPSATSFPMPTSVLETAAETDETPDPTTPPPGPTSPSPPLSPSQR